MGNHSMLPPPEIDANLRSVEDPSPYPSGPNTSFHDPTPMPARFTEEAVPALNKQRQEEKKRKQLKAHKSRERFAKMDLEHQAKQQGWLAFQAGKKKGARKPGGGRAPGRLPVRPPAAGRKRPHP
mgnify:CR=1 FL=1